MAASKTVVAFGEVLWDLLPGGAVPGGAPFNFINRIREFGHRGIMVSRVGRDDRGREALEIMGELRLDTRYVQVDDRHPTGTVQVTLDAHNNADYHIVEGVAYDYIDWSEAMEELLAVADFFCFGSLAQRAPRSRETLGRLIDRFSGPYLLCDINLRKNCYTLPVIDESLQRSNICKMNDDELRVLGQLLRLGGDDLDELATRLLDHYGLLYLLVTLGNRGVFALSSGGEKIYEPAYRVQVADTIGSGDSFTAAFTHSLLDGATFRDACRFGSLVGALVATQKGGTQRLLRSDIENFRLQAVHGPEEPSLARYR
jgi:fructokinase